MKEVPLDDPRPSGEAGPFLACLATVLELPLERLPALPAGEDPASGWTVSRWLGGLGLGLVPVADPASFAWAGPWLARLQSGGAGRWVVMFGVPSTVVWDPTGTSTDGSDAIEQGYVVAAGDIALALPPPFPPACGTGRIEGIHVADSAGKPTRALETVEALPGRGLAGDRHVLGTGTFPSGPSGSALTLIEAEVCESFDPPLAADEHRRNLVTRGVDLNGLIGREFSVGAVRCHGVRLCEPCAVVERYASRPVLRLLVHRGGLRADIIAGGPIHLGDRISVRGEA